MSNADGRIAQLVGDDADLLARLGKPQHGADEIRAEGAMDPGGAQDHAVLRARRDQKLALEFRSAIGACRAGRVVLAIGPIEPPVEDIIGREMNEGNAKPRRRLGDMAGAVRIDAHRQIRLGFRLVDRRIGGGVDDRVRARGGERFEHAVALRADRARAARARRPRRRRLQRVRRARSRPAPDCR